MDFTNRLSISFYKNIAPINHEHNICLVQHQQTLKIFVKKNLEVYNKSIYQRLHAAKIEGIPQIVELYEEDSSLTLIEEYISGETLQDKIDAHSLTESDICLYIKELCNTLNKLHSLNPPVIHRDIKPANIMITPSNHVILIDFNAAKYFTDIKTPDTILLGTKGYAAPEQYGFGSSTQQTDIYAIGILMKELIASLKIPTQIFSDIIPKCIQINPNDRFSSVLELSNKLPYKNLGKHNSPTTKFLKKLIPPGFRTHTPWHMFLASIVYAFLFLFCLSLEIESTFGILLWAERIVCLFIFLSFIFSATNYLNVQKLMPLCQNKFFIVRIFGIILLDFIFLFLFIFFLIVLTI